MDLGRNLQPLLSLLSHKTWQLAPKERPLILIFSVWQRKNQMIYIKIFTFRKIWDKMASDVLHGMKNLPQDVFRYGFSLKRGVFRGKIVHKCPYFSKEGSFSKNPRKRE